MPDGLIDLWRDLLSIDHIKFLLAAGWIAYLLGLGMMIVLQKRHPAATISWLISLAALHYLGFLIYYFLGPQKIQRQRLRRVRARAALPPPPPGMEPDAETIELARLGQASTGLPPTTATSVTLLVDGAAKYEQLMAAVAGATQHVHLEYYIFLPDRTGQALLDGLVERARAGVKVRLLLDAVGSGKV